MHKKTLNNLENSDENSFKIPLTIKDRKECDKLVIDNYYKEKIENMVFHFEYFYPKDKSRYLIKISYSKENLSFLERLEKIMKGIKEKKFWKIEVDKIDDNGEFICHCMTTLPGSSEGIELQKIFENTNDNLREKIIAFLRKHKYNNVDLEYKNLNL